MKYFFVLIVCFTTHASAQITLNFNKRYVESENKWVAIKTAKDSVYGYGFIYMDVQAGLTAHEEGIFKITKDNVFVATKNPPYAMRLIRLQDNQAKVAWIPVDRLKEMQEPETPSWLASYKTDTTSAAWLFKWGFTYNGGNEIDKALYYLNRVKKINPNYPGLDFEFIYAYNASRQFDKAEAFIQEALKSRPRDGNLYKELLYAQVTSEQLDKAEETYKKAITFCSIDAKSEMALNIASNYLQHKNKEKFNYWANDIQTWLPTTSPRYRDLIKMKELIEK